MSETICHVCGTRILADPEDEKPLCLQCVTRDAAAAFAALGCTATQAAAAFEQFAKTAPTVDDQETP